MFTSLLQMVTAAETQGLPLSEIILNGEIEQTGATRADLFEKMGARLSVMRQSAQQGLTQPERSISGLTGGDAHQFWGWIQNHQPVTGSLLSKAIARAISVNEVNACMGCIVATPTAGSAGILPAVLITLAEDRNLNDENVIRALFTAGGIGTVIARITQVSGAAGGCQAEIGSATAMAAGAGVELLGGTARQSMHAVAIALKNMLGLVCDPVAGLVEIPCIKRNAAGASQAFVAIDLAIAGIESAIPADEVIDAMAHIGQRMDERFRETAQGGLAATPTGKRIAQQVWGKEPKY